MNTVHSVAELIEQTRHMPLERMRFFINEDRREPRCFGIYQDPVSRHWVVYKNKSDGSRAVRYSGPDEAHAAQELWLKINSEIDLRRAKQAPVKQTPAQKRQQYILLFLIAIVMAVSLFFFIRKVIREPKRGYYVVNDAVYYYQDDDWYYYDHGDWYSYNDSYDDDWFRSGEYSPSRPSGIGYSDSFEQSRYYEEPSNSDSDIFDSWDSGDTDWDSDW